MIVAALRKGGIRNLETECNFAVGLPIQAMLAKPCNSATQVLGRMRTFGNRFTCEYKYDGLRAQFHFPLGSISNETSSSSSQSSSQSSSSQSSSSQSSSSSAQSSSSSKPNAKSKSKTIQKGIGAQMDISKFFQKKPVQNDNSGEEKKVQISSASSGTKTTEKQQPSASNNKITDSNTSKAGSNQLMHNVSKIGSTSSNKTQSTSSKDPSQQEDIHMKYLLTPQRPRIYSRNKENLTEMYPDALAQIIRASQGPGVTGEALKGGFVIDSEIVAYDRENKKILPFQVLQQRSRKGVASVNDVKVQVCIVCFDLLAIGGRSIMNLPLEQRRQVLRESFAWETGKLQISES
ncbi:MAG: putative DNA ligase 1, partial [Streblomastix strix]